MKRAVIISLSIGSAGALALAGFLYWQKTGQDSNAVSSAGGSIKLEGGETGGRADGISMSAESGQSASVQSQPSNNPPHAIAGTSNTVASPSAAPRSQSLPGPSDFIQYEQYKDAANALFIDSNVGTGVQAAAGNTLTVQYRGWLTNGQEFDESYARNQAFSFTLGAHTVIAGWEQGMLGMKVGGKRRLIIPPSVGYGNQAVGSIPPGSLLVFDVELVGIK